MLKSRKPASAEDDEEMWRIFEQRSRQVDAPKKRDKARADLLKAIAKDWKKASADYKSDILAAIRKTDGLRDLSFAAEKDVEDTKSYPPLEKPEEEGLTAELDLAPTFEMHLKATERLLEIRRRGQAALRALNALQMASSKESNKDSRAGVKSMVAQMDKDINKMAKELDAKRKQLPQHQKAAAARAESRRDRGRLGKGWVGSWTLGDGTFGKAELFLKQNSDGSIIDRIVVKDSNFGDDTIWERDEFWSADLKHPSNKIPTEIFAMGQLKGRSENIVQIRNWRIETASRSHRIYMEFCPHGDLYDVMDKARTRKQAPPEPFAWHCFECLATSGVVMEKGGVEANPVLPWDPVLHRDLKLENVFLGLPSQTRYRRFPTPKVGDFGFALVVPEDDEPDWSKHGRSGTEGYTAPEQVVYADDDEREALTSKTDVYSAGMTMWSLMMLESGNDELEFTSEDDEDLEPKFGPVEIEKYSAWLRDLVLACTSFDPDDRPSFSHLLSTIRRHTGPGKTTDLAKGLRDAPNDSVAWAGNTFGLKRVSWQLFVNLENILFTSAKEDKKPLKLPKGDKVPRAPFKKRRSSDSHTESESESDDLGGPAGAELNALKRKAEEAPDGDPKKKAAKIKLSKKGAT